MNPLSRTTQRSRAAAAVGSILLLTIAACGGGQQAGASDEPVTIGVVAEMSGAGATVGEMWERGVQMAIEDINDSGGILGRQVDTFTLDTKTDPATSVAAMRRAVEREPLAVMGTVFSSSTIVNMEVLADAGIPQFTGSASPDITAQGNKNIFQTSLTAAQTVESLKKWLIQEVQPQKLALIYVNDEYGQAGRTSVKTIMQDAGIPVVADLAIDVGQSNFTGVLTQLAQSNADTLFLYIHEEEAGRLLPQLAARGLKDDLAIVGDTSILQSDTINLAKDAANGIRGLITFGPIGESMQPLAEQFTEQYGGLPDHNFYKAYTGTWLVKYGFEEVGELDQQAFREYLHGRTFCQDQYAKLLGDVHIDGDGRQDRASLIIEIQDQHQTVVGTAPFLNPENFTQCQ